MKRIMLMVTVVLMLALMVALSGAALAAPGNGGHVYGVDFGLTYSGGAGGSATGGGGGGHLSGDEFNAGVLQFNSGSGGGGSDAGGGGGGGGCTTFVLLGERTCNGSGGHF